MWRDEMQVFLLGAYSPTLSDLFRKLEYETHPDLWHLLVWLAARISDAPVAMQAVHVVLASIVWLLVWRLSPFKAIDKFLLLLSYFLFWEHFVLGRNYVLVARLSACKVFPITALLSKATPIWAPSTHSRLQRRNTGLPNADSTRKNSVSSAAGLASAIRAPLSDTSIKWHSRHHVPSIAMTLAASGFSNWTRGALRRSSNILVMAQRSLSGGDIRAMAEYRFFREQASFAPGHKPEDAPASRAFERQHFVPVLDRCDARERPLHIAYNTIGFSVHGGRSRLVCVIRCPTLTRAVNAFVNLSGRRNPGGCDLGRPAHIAEPRLSNRGAEVVDIARGVPETAGPWMSSPDCAGILLDRRSHPMCRRSSRVAWRRRRPGG
jgi:hypothetical protein